MGRAKIYEIEEFVEKGGSPINYIKILSAIAFIAIGILILTGKL